MKSLKSLFTLSTLIFLSACQGELIDIPASSQDSPHEVTLTKVRQRVHRYNCEGVLTSNTIEVIKEPKEFMKITPTSYTDLLSSSFHNETTGSSPGWITNFDSFNINSSPTVFDMRVEVGTNTINYSFQYCLEWAIDPETNAKTCKTPGHEETGTRYIKVHYNEYQKEGLSERRPTPEECAESEEESK